MPVGLPDDEELLDDELLEDELLEDELLDDELDDELLDDELLDDELDELLEEELLDELELVEVVPELEPDGEVCPPQAARNTAAAARGHSFIVIMSHQNLGVVSFFFSCLPLNDSDGHHHIDKNVLHLR